VNITFKKSEKKTCIQVVIARQKSKKWELMTYICTSLLGDLDTAMSQSSTNKVTD
jgi:hypothetical protein